ncbi:MAG: DUF2225 domain-containing protein [bacterium]|jgi:hypothetical protein
MSIQELANRPQIEDEKDFWLKELRCPLCRCDFKSTQLRSRAYRVVRREPDFFIHYEGTVPWLYELAVCPQCGFSGEAREWANLVVRDPDMLRERLQEAGAAGLRSLCGPRTAAEGVATFRYALVTYACCEVKIYQRANLALRGGYMARVARESGAISGYEVENEFKSEALTLFLDSYQNEYVETTRFGASGIAFIIGELYRQLADYKQAVVWFSRAVSAADRHPEIERLARYQWEIARGEYRRLMEGGEGPAAPRERSIERTVLNIYRDQADWILSSARAAGLSQEEFIRTLLDVIMEGGIDWATFPDKKEMKNRIRVTDSGARKDAKA